MSPTARVLKEADPEAASRLALWAKDVTAGEYDPEARTFRVTEGKEDLFRQAARLAGVELQWEQSSNPGRPEAPAGVKSQTEGNPGAEQFPAAGNPGQEAGPGRPTVPPAAVLVGVGLAGLLAWSLLRPAQ